MRSKTSFFNGTIFKKNISHYWPLWLVFFVYLICQLPVGLFLGISAVDASNSAELLLQWKTDAYFCVLKDTLNPVSCFAAGAISAMAVFHFMYYARCVHAYHSLPVRREELFLTNYFSGFLFYTVPLLLSFLMGACICALKGITSLEYLLIWFLLMEGMCFFFYNMTILVGMFTGQFFAVPLLTLILNYLYVGCRYVLLTIMGMISYGLSDVYSDRLVSFLSPLYFMMGKVNFAVDWSGNKSSYLINGCQYVAVYAGLGLIGGIAAFFMYRKRKVECVGDILAIGAVKPVFRWIFAGAVSMLFATIVCGSIPQKDSHKQFLMVLFVVLVMGVICFFAAEMLLQRKFKVWKGRRFLECGIYSLVMAAFLICLECDVFGMEKRLPDVSEIARAQLNLYYPLYGEEEEDIEQILKIHRRIIDSKEEFEDYYANGKQGGYATGYVGIRYVLKDGTPFIRNYQIPVDKAYLMDEGSVVSDIRKASCDVEMYLKGNLCLNFADVEIKSISLDVYNEELEVDELSIEEQDWKLFFEALKADILEGNILVDLGNDNEQEDDYNYWNSLNMELFSSKGIRDYWDEVFTEDAKAQSAVYCITFNRRCSHILEVVNHLGLVNETDHQLLTGKEYVRIQEEQLEE